MNDKITQCLKSFLQNHENKDTNFEPLEFWKANKIIPSLLKRFLELNGFRILSNNATSKVIKLTYNIVDIYNTQEIFNFCLKFVESKNSELGSVFIEQGEKYLMTRKALLGSLKPIELNQYKDDIFKSLHFYNNCIVEVNKTTIKTISYDDFQNRNEFIYKNSIIKRPFELVDQRTSQFEKFIRLSTNTDEHFKSVCTSIGYLLHRYKNPANAKAVILSDLLSQATNEANGRSGKGLIIKAISEFINLIEYNGKNLDLKRDKFVYQSIDDTTDLFVIQDVSKNFEFEDLFSQITDNMDVQKKHQQKMIIQFSESPKIAITTNYTIPKNTDSYADRKQLIILNNYFNANHKPQDEFRNLFFLEWNEAEYKSFDNFIMVCIQMFLKYGLVSYDDPELKRQNLINNTSKMFVELMEGTSYLKNEYYSIKELAEKLEINSNEKSVRSKLTKQWLIIYSSYTDLKIEFRTSGGFEKFYLF